MQRKKKKKIATDFKTEKEKPRLDDMHCDKELQHGQGFDKPEQSCGVTPQSQYCAEANSTFFIIENRDFVFLKKEKKRKKGKQNKHFDFLREENCYRIKILLLKSRSQTFFRTNDFFRFRFRDHDCDCQCVFGHS